MRSAACVEIGGAVDDGGRFAAELQRHGRQIAPGGLRDQAPDAGRARKHQMVERQRCEGLGDVLIDSRDDHLLGVELLRDHFDQ